MINVGNTRALMTPAWNDDKIGKTANQIVRFSFEMVTRHYYKHN